MYSDCGGFAIITPPKRPFWIVSWMRAPPGVAKLIVDGCSRGNPRMAASGGILCDHRGVGFGYFWVFSWLLADPLHWACDSLWGVGSCCLARLLCAWGRVRLGHGGFVDSFLRSCSLGLCLFAASSVCFDFFFSNFGEACLSGGHFCYRFFAQLGLYSSG